MTAFTLSLLVALLSELRRAKDRATLVRTVEEGLERALEPRKAIVYLLDDKGCTGEQGSGPCITPGIVESLARVSALNVGSSRMGWPATKYAEEDLEFLRATEAKLLVPVRDADEKLEAILVLGPRRGGALYSQEEIELISSVGSHLASALENLRLSDEVRTRRDAEQDLRREIETAREVQESFLPERPPDVDGLDLAAICIPARICGGDYYDFQPLGDGRLAVTVADVSGKGLAAALLMSKVQATLRTTVDAGAGVVESARAVNRTLHQLGLHNRFVTFFFGVVDPRERQLRYVNAGHNPPLLSRTGASKPEKLLANAAVLGIVDEWRGKERVVEINPGDVLLAYTDGLSEAHSPRGEEFGEERIESGFRCALDAGLDAGATIQCVLEEVRSFGQTDVYTDDLTLSVVRFLS